MKQRSTRLAFISLVAVLLCVTVFVLADMAYGDEPSNIKIAAVEAPWETLPDLPQRTEVQVETRVQMLWHVGLAKRTMEQLGGQIDVARESALDCEAYLGQYHEVAALPVLKATAAEDAIQYASGQHSEAVADALDTSRGMYLHCRETLAGTAAHGEISFQSWGPSRQGIVQSVDRLGAAVGAGSRLAEPMTIHVAPGGSDDLPILEVWVDVAPPGSTLVLEPGVYDLAELLTIGKPISLMGTGMDETEIVSEAEGDGVRFDGDGPFVAEGITFRHKGTAWANVVVVEGGEIHFTGCRFTGGVWSEEEKTGGNGLLIAASTVGRVEECRAEGNQIDGIVVAGQAQPVLVENVCTDNKEAGITYWADAGGVALKNECSKNVWGVFVGEQAQPTLEENVCTDNEQDGISYWDDAGGIARKNECSRNGWGIYVGGQAQPTLEKNVCTDNEEDGISHWDDAGGIARKNECSRNRWGISVGGQAQPTLEENVCTDNEQDGISYWDDAGGMAYKNICSENGDFGIVYWDNASGIARQNECTKNQRGIYVGDQAQPTLEENICTGNYMYGISFRDAAGGVARKNECSRNQWGIYVGERAQPMLEENSCRDNWREGISYWGNAGGIARKNILSGNGEGCIGVHDQAHPTLEDNTCSDDDQASIAD